jgi:Tol biopolymer transport system component
MVGALASAQLALTGAPNALASGPILQVTADGTSSVRPAWSPDGTRIAYQTSQNNAYQIFTMAADGSDRRLVTQGPVDDRHPAWSPDGAVLAVDSGTELQREIWLLDANSGARTQITRVGAFASFPSWSRDGTRLSFYVYQKGALDLWTVNKDGSKPVQMTQTLASENKSQCTFACHAASWSPDGSRLAYADGDQRQVFTMRADDGTDQVKVSHDDPTGRSHFPEYLSDGRLTYVTEHINPGQAFTDIWAMTPGSNQPPVQMLQNVQVQGPFEFSPDQQKLLFASPRNGSFDIYVATLDASGRDALRQLGAATDLAPALVAAGHPTAVPIPANSTAPVAAPAGATPVAAPAPAPVVAPQAAIVQMLLGFGPYVVALIGVTIFWIGVEAVIIARRRRRSHRS